MGYGPHLSLGLKGLVHVTGCMHGPVTLGWVTFCVSISAYGQPVRSSQRSLDWQNEYRLSGNGECRHFVAVSLARYVAQVDWLGPKVVAAW